MTDRHESECLVNPPPLAGEGEVCASTDARFRELATKPFRELTDADKAEIRSLTSLEGRGFPRAGKGGRAT